MHPFSCYPFLCFINNDEDDEDQDNDDEDNYGDDGDDACIGEVVTGKSAEDARCVWY